ncbi:unnamed protein product [Penicillium olsonii]|nr:unnamed protein product [Penicillium olsonii]
MAIRHCIELGYHRSTDKFHRNLDTLAKEMIKRCFWVAYDLDRTAAFTLGRPLGIPEECIDVELPANVDDEYITASGYSCHLAQSSSETPTTITGAIHVIRLRKLWVRFDQELYSKRGLDSSTRATRLNTLRHDLDQWRLSTPDPYPTANYQPLSVFVSAEWFQLAYDHSILLLYRPYMISGADAGRENTAFFIGEGRQDIDESLAIERAYEECSVRSREICLLYRKLHREYGVQFTWGSLHILFLASLTYLYCLSKSPRVQQLTRQGEVSSTCMACSTVLSVMAERWRAAAPFLDLFEKLAEATINKLFANGYFRPAEKTPVKTSSLDLSQVHVSDESEILIQSLWQEQDEIQFSTAADFDAGGIFASLTTDVADSPR